LYDGVGNVASVRARFFLIAPRLKPDADIGYGLPISCIPAPAINPHFSTLFVQG
jgi:hypothetical protein